MLAALANRRFAAYLAAATISDGGYWISFVAQGWLVEKLTNSPLWLGVISAVSQLPFLLFSLAGGDLADRFDRRKLIAGTNAVIGIVALVTAALVASGLISVWWLAVLGFSAGSMLAIEHPIDRAWLYDLVDGQHLGTSIALSALEWATARTLGPAIGGLAIATIGISAGYAAYTVCVIPLILVALFMPASRRGANAAADVVAPDAKTARAVVVFCIFTALFTIGVTPYLFLLPDIAKNTFGQGAAGYGAMAAAGGIGAIAGALTLSLRGGIKRVGRGTTIVAFIGAVLLVVFAQVHTMSWALVVLAAMGAFDTLMYALANTYVQAIAGDAERGRANAIFSLAFLGGIPLGNALLGVLAGTFGTGASLAWSGAIVAAAAAAFWFGFPHARDAA